MRRRRTFIGVKDIAGYGTRLKGGFDEIGVDSVFVNLDTNPFGYATCGYDFILAKGYHTTLDRIRERQGSVVRFLHYAVLFAYRAAIFLHYLARCDAFVFLSTTTFFGFKDLPLLRLLGKTVVFVMFGSDSRPAYLDAALLRNIGRSNIDGIADYVRRQKETMRRMERYADCIVDHVPSGQLHEKPFVQWLYVGIPSLSPDGTEDVVPAVDGPTRIVHSPSDPEVKGTERIRNAIADLKEQGAEIEYVEIINLPNSHVLHELARCDFVVDAVYADTPMATLSSEAAYFAKPSVMSGYELEQLRRLYPPEIWPPSCTTEPNRLADAIWKMIYSTEQRIQLGRESQAFLLRYWTPSQVASRMRMIIEGCIPSEWWYDPAKIDFYHGGGISRRHLSSLLSRIIEEHGISALQLDDKPLLIERIRS